MKKIVSLILSLVMLMSITSGLNLTAYADDVNHYLDFQAEIYSSETAGFDNIFVGTDSSSFSRTLYNNLKNDTKFQVTLAAWSSTHIVDDATYTIENNVFKKKDLYDAILFDMIDSTDESTLCQQYQNEFEKLYKMVKNERSSYVIKTTDMILGKENYTVEQLKTTDLSEDAKDLLLNGTKYAGVTSVISEVNKILGNVKNAYDAINAVADYLAIKDVDCGTSEILNEIASDSQSPIELRYSAAEISDCMAGAYGKTAALIAEGSISGIEFALNKAINYAWDSVLACIPGGTAISFGAKTGRMLVNYFFKTETVIQGYYQLEAAVNIEDAIIRVMQNKKNADTGYTNIDSAVYMKSVDMYKDIILLGFDYSIELLQNAANSDFNTATDFWLGNYSQCMQLIDQIQELKQKKIDNFVKYEEIVFNKYKSLYLPNYDELEDEISKTVPVTALSVTQLVDINIGDSAYFEDCFAYNFEPYNYTESVTNVSITSSDSNIISVVKGDDSKEKFVANNAGTCTLTFTLNDRITCQKEVTVGSITSGKCGENVIYSLDTSTGVLTISGTGHMYDYADWKKSYSPFHENEQIKSVIIESGVTWIGDYTFSNCTTLTSAQISDSVTHIGKYAFSGCSNLTSITLPNGLEDINEHTFYNCTSLTSITIPNKVRWVCFNAFNGCSSLKNVTMSNGIQVIDDGAFHGCKSLTSITIPSSVWSIADNAFGDCSSLINIDVDKDNQTYSSQDGVLFNKDKTVLINYPIGSERTSYNIPDSVTNIGEYAFADCKNLKSIMVSNSLTHIGEYAFSGCTNLTCVTIPNSVTSIGEYAFSSCKSLTSVIIPDGVTRINESTFRECTSLKSIIIGNGVTVIDRYAFYNCKNLICVTIPNSVTVIGWYVFDICSSLETVNYKGTKAEWKSIDISDENYNLIGAMIKCTDGIIGYAHTVIDNLEYSLVDDTATVIGYTFASQSVSIPKSVDYEGYKFDVTSIGGHAFDNCTSLLSVVIPDSVTSISDGAFFDCEGLKDVYYTSTEDEWNKITIGNDNENLTNATIHYNFEPEPSNKQTGSCGDNVTYSLDTETGVLTISGTGKMKDYSGEDSPFYQNSNIKSVIIENGVTSIGNLAFSSCNSLIEVSLPSSIISLGVSAFSGCENLMSISIPANVADIQSIAFAGCKKLTSIEVDSNNENYSSINGVLFDKNITELVCYPAGKNDASYTVPNTVKSFAYGSFYDCENLTSVIIPSGVTSIGGASFWNCKNLKSIVIPKSVTKIDLFSFNGCESLKDIYYTGTQDEWNNITIGDGNINLTSATIHYNFEPCIENQHNYYGEWKIIEEPTCTKVGLKQRTCSFDGYVQKEEIPAKGHTEVVINGYAATCEKSGLTDGKKCSACGEVLEAQKEIAKLGHSYTKTVVEPTCTEQGYTIYKCETCGETYKDDYVKAKGHDFSNNAQFCLNGCGKVNPNYVAPDTSTVQTGSCGDNVIYSLNTETGVLTISGTGEMTDSPFSQNSSIKSVIIENGVTSILTYAFSGCTSLTSITIPDSVTSIGESAFDGCTSLVSVTLSKSITTIEYSTFFGCSSLTSIEIPKSVTTIVNFAFCGCTNLKDVYYDGTQSEWNKINIGHSNECLTNASLHCSLTPTPEPTPTPTPEPTPTPNPAPQPSTQPTQETSQQAAQQTSQQQSVKNDTATEQVNVAKPKSTNTKKIKAAKKAVSVEWKKVSGVSGYEIQLATDKKFKKNKKTVTVKKQKTTKTTVKKLKAKKKYYVRVRTYKIVNGKKVYSSWSKVKSVKTK